MSKQPKPKWKIHWQVRGGSMVDKGYLWEMPCWKMADNQAATQLINPTGDAPDEVLIDAFESRSLFVLWLKYRWRQMTLFTNGHY